LYILPFVLERAPALQRISGSDWGLRLDYTYTLANTNADVVIFGDSSALYGIDAPRLSRELGLHVINLPQSIGTLVVNEDRPLLYYLAHNKPPRIIVFTVMPWNRDFHAVSNALVYEGIEQVIRHGSSSSIVDAARAYPRDLATFPLSFYLVQSRFTQLPKSTQPSYQLRDGSEPYSASGLPISGTCAFSREQLAAHSDRSMRQLQADAAQRGIPSLSLVSPVPQCANVDRLKAFYGPALTVMPANYFADDHYLAHLLQDHRNDVTGQLAIQVRATLATIHANTRQVYQNP
jgi:hypothetical protein